MPHEEKIRFWATVGLLLLGLAFRPAGEAPAALAEHELLEVKVHRLIMDPGSNQPVVLLADAHEERALLIWIDFFEAQAIYAEMQEIKHRRPLTHDLLEKIIQQVKGKIHHIVIPFVRENTFYATLVMEREGSLVEIDARPSDSIVMALKFKAPIFVAKTLFAEMAVPLGEPPAIEEEYGITIQDLTPALARYFSFSSERGVLVSDVRKGSRAEKDGIQISDIIVEVEGQPIANVVSLKEALGQSKPSAKAMIFRNAQILSIVLHLNG
ncbi:MAG: bifunctional nuclease family protein [Desulfobacterales bacterium]|nr:MAG: bifunctional nuclease family protein [Desulfobacterales bacterium]